MNLGLVIDKMTVDNSSFTIDCERVSQTIAQEIANYVKQSKTKGVVVGLSGGIDSSVVAALAVQGLGRDKVLGLILPNTGLEKSYEKDARELAKQLKIEIKKISIADFVDAFTKNVEPRVTESKVVLGNAMARFRMVLLYAYANYLDYLVVGTSNKTEILVGYITKYGDGGVDFEPCGQLYKTHIRQLARYLKIPEAIITKAPSAGLWKGQTDEGELGITYELLDRILLSFEQGLSDEQIRKDQNIEQAEIDRVRKMVSKSEHKRKMPPVFEVLG
jgi:NAD+ synthase